ncbi:unnamed protein product [Peronospora destructor]|uniref:Phosphate acetyl/butaryl transferase domain-containing protein n=1 Tax=Peronospora destructor TaxID=86335 RepID=A0AAV0TFD1_9STRA|nr:unnamed protein product [Peronospora destructor]
MANDAVVTSAVAAASALKDQFVHLKNYKDGALIITSADRSDLMLGLRVSQVPGNADGVVSGACHTIANTIRPALQLIKTTPNRPNVSSIFFICLEDGVRIYGDCAVNTDPSAQDLAQIAVTSAESAEAFGLIPKVALLSYATGDSNSGPIVDKVREATKIAQELRPDLDIYGPIQYDAAVDEAIAKTKLKAIPSGAKVGGQADQAIRKRKADAVASKSS